MGRSAVAKKLASAEEIQSEILRRIQASNDHDGDCRGCKAPTPVLTAMADGGNWTINSIDKVPGCERFLLNIVAQVRWEYDLKE